MNRGRAVALILLSFLFGTAFGWWSFRWYQRRPRPAKEHYERVLNRLNSELGLSAEQNAKVGAVLDSERQRMDKMHADAETSFQSIHQETIARIRQLLDPDQQKKLDALEAKFQQRMKAHPENGRLP